MRTPSAANSAAGDSRAATALAGLVGHRHDDREPAGVVDDDLEVVVAEHGVPMSRGAPATDPMAATVGDAAELLVVLVEQGARMAGHVADRGPGRPGRRRRSRLRPSAGGRP